MELVKIKVCAVCQSTDITDVNCVCVGGGMFSKYDTVELEFESCECCSRIDSEPSETSEHNIKHWSK